MTDCQYFPKCSGCSLWNLPYIEQKKRKISYLADLLKSHDLEYNNQIEFISSAEKELRHRVDFTIQFDDTAGKHLFGFYDKNKSLIHINSCLQLTPELQKIYSEFISFNFFYNNTPIRKGSVRLRISPEGLKGCWLDFSNIDVKNLLEDKMLLNSLLDAGFIVEIGQKGKNLIRSEGVLKLKDPVPHVWFETVDASNKVIPLKCLISDFTQPSWLTAKVLVSETLRWVHTKKDIKSILEFGSGIGQFTLGFLSLNSIVEVCEINSSSLEQLKINSASSNLGKNLIIHCGDFHIKNLNSKLQHDLAFVNPARSGLKKFTETIMNLDAKYIIYVSCFPESMIADLQKLKNNYSVCYIKIIDQFPQTEHFESLTILEKIK